MARPLDAGSGDDRIAEARAKARLAKEQADARRSRVRADLAEGRVIELADAQEQIMRLASAVRRALELAPSYLPASLTPDNRDACASALQASIAQAMMALPEE